MIINGTPEIGFCPRKYIHQKGSVLVIELPSEDVQPNSISSHIIELEGDWISVKNLPFSVNARKLVDYWVELEMRGFPLSELAHGIVTSQRISIVTPTGELSYPAVPVWEFLIELLSLMKFFEDEYSKDCNLKEKFSELRKKMSPVKRDKWKHTFQRGDLRTYLEMVQHVVNDVMSILSEFRFAKILADEDIDFRFIRKGGDIVITRTGQVVDITRRSSDLIKWAKLIEAKKVVRIDLKDVVKACKRTIERRAIEKGLFNGRIDILAVDVTSHELGTAIWALHTFDEADFSPETWLQEIINSKKDVIFFSYVHRLGFYTLPLKLK